ncbi:MAG: cryptochrome/photolyase family protein [Micavibrio sp.]
MSNASKKAIVWFRQDLRLHDNPALAAAVDGGYDVIPLYILDDINAGPWKMGGASRWWLHHSLNALNKSLSGKMIFRVGAAQDILPSLVQEYDIKAVFWNRCYEPWRINRDKVLKSQLEDEGVEVKSYNSALLFEPWTITKDDGTPYKVFTPFFRKGCLKAQPPAEPLKAPAKIKLADIPFRQSIDELSLLPLPPQPRWDIKMQDHWEIGEQGALSCLKNFIEEGLKGYKEGRNFPSLPHVSRLSPYLHFGEISPRTVWHKIKEQMIVQHAETDGDHFLSEMGWREFSYGLLYHNPDLPHNPLQERFNNFPWHKDDKALHAWQTGMTGYPIVDAGMRELWQTGYMHNRVRMIVGSFLVKDLLLHWREGEKWFWDCLVDADLANNAASWQWIAGCGADAAPYFRVFNPVGQGEKFDPQGDYVRMYCPELAKLPDNLIHRPWEAPPLILKESGITLGKTYPAPIVDHKLAREKALAAFQFTKNQA